MKKILIAFCFILLSQIITAQTAGSLYKYIGKSKADIKKELAALEFVRDWGTGSSMDYEEPGPNMLKFRFDVNDICTGVSFMSFDPEPERIKSEMDAITKEGWTLDHNWQGNNFDNFSFKKGDKFFRLKNSADQVMEIGYMDSGAKWPEEPSK